ncbi:GNAT family N-acetyltransferase [Propylenella binzhouense]|uniref:GNAT family N-acetyltransferase n=1 Tax=Propylenella binzhouense TaxID=2555902 RepID=UPI0031B5F8DF
MSGAPRDRTYRFRDVGEADFALLARWLAEPHVAEWWGDPAKSLAGIRAAARSASTRAMIVECASEPIAYMQHYDIHREEDHPYRDQPKGTLGLDLSIGRPDLVGKGHGSAMLAQYAGELLEAGAPRVLVDPDPRNARAIRAYAKAGFAAFDERTTIYGPALLMARDA